MGYRRDLVRIVDMANRHVDAVAKMQARFAQWRDPRARALRKRRRAVRSTTAWTGTGVVTGTGAVVVEAAVAAPGASVPVLIGTAVVSGVAAIASGVRTWRLHRQPLPEPARAPVALPPHDSQAREPMRALADAEDTLRELLTQLSRGALIPQDSVDHSRRTGAEAAEALRAVSAQLQAVERARDHAPAADRAALTAGIHALRTQLEEGVEGYCALVAAAGRALAASTGPTPRHDLTNATDHLAALALALRELSPHSH
ncbi:phage shock envelope stress response protein PspM [Actinokineospora sp. NPDC004072]